MTARRREHTPREKEIIRRLVDGENPYDIDPEYGCTNPLTGYFPEDEVSDERERREMTDERMTDEEMNEQTGGTLQPEEKVLTIIGGVRTGVWDRDEHGWRRRP